MADKDDKTEPKTTPATPAKAEKPAVTKVYSIVKGKSVEIPCALEPVKDGYSTTQDFERRLTALEIAVGIKKINVEEVEVKVKK